MKLRLREEKIINAESSRRDKSCSEEQNAVIEFESQKKATESTGTTNSTSVKDAPTEQNSSKIIGTGMETSLQDKIIYFPREKEIKNESKSIDYLGSENNKETTERKPQLEQMTEEWKLYFQRRQHSSRNSQHFRERIRNREKRVASKNGSMRSCAA